MSSGDGYSKQYKLVHTLMEILQDTLDRLLSPLSGLNTQVTVIYSGSVLTVPPKVNFDAPFTQQEIITFVVQCKALGIRGQTGIYQLVDKVRKAILGKRVVGFDPLATGVVEVSAQYQGEVESGYYQQNLVIQISRPITTHQNIC